MLSVEAVGGIRVLYRRCFVDADSALCCCFSFPITSGCRKKHEVQGEEEAPPKQKIRGRPFISTWKNQIAFIDLLFLFKIIIYIGSSLLLCPCL